jgi:N-acetylglutamate synthase-like GNAT family acetyltransferase
MIDKQTFTVRRARPADVPRMMPLLNKYVAEGEILPRSQDDVFGSVRSWVVAEAENTRIVGVGALAIISQDLAEVRSLVVNPDYHRQGLGRRIVEMLLDEARELAIARVFALTRKPNFFLRLGFGLTRLEKLPAKVRRDCVFCPIFHACDEVALIISMKDLAFDSSPASGSIQAKNGTMSQPIPLLSK